MAGLAAVLCAVFLTASPAAAAGHPTGFPVAHGDNGLCLGSGSAYGTQGEICIFLALYTASSGQRFVTAEVEGDCADSTGKPLACSNIVADATVANGAGYTAWATMACGHTNGNCDANGTYFYPYGGLPISEGGCDNNVWAVLWGQNHSTYITLPRSGVNYFIDINVEDGHFSRVCLTNGSLYAFA